ncbi:MAG: MFS transporter [Solirubrobacteraceae bacterium]
MSSVGLLSFGGRGRVLVGIALGIAMVGIDASIVSVANATIGRDLHASLAGLQWVTNAYLLALCILLLTGGRIADRLGRRTVFLAGVSGFALASGGCALAGSVGELIAFRALQGAAGALLMPSSLAIVRATFPDDELDRAISVWAAAATLSLIAGPIIGGLLVEHISWQSVFLLNLPVALLAIAGTLRFATESRDPTAAGSYDLPGIAAASGGLFLLVFALIKTQAHGWGSTYTLGLLATGLALLGLFVIVELRGADPMLPLGLFRSRTISSAAAATIVMYFCLFAVLFFWTLYLQRIHGDSPAQSGIHLLPLTISFVAAAAVIGAGGSRIHPRIALAGGLLLLALGLLLLARTSATSTIAAMSIPLAITGVGFGVVGVVSIQAILGNAPVEYAGSASAVVSTLVQLGGVLGTSILGSVIATHATSDLAAQLAHLQLHNHKLAPQLAAQLAHHATTAIAQGGLHTTGALPPALTGQIARRGPAAFVSGLQTATRLAALVAAIGAPLGLLVKRGRNLAGFHLA